MDKNFESEMSVRNRICAAFEYGLAQEFGILVGEILYDVYEYGSLEESGLVTRIKEEQKKIDEAINQNKVDGSTMWSLRWIVAASAILCDFVGVKHWANVGLMQCHLIDFGWNRSRPEWQWILENVEEYTKLVTGIRKFKN